MLVAASFREAATAHFQKRGSDEKTGSIAIHLLDRYYDVGANLSLC
jgi:hypothetical protein